MVILQVFNPWVEQGSEGVECARNYPLVPFHNRINLKVADLCVIFAYEPFFRCDLVVGTRGGKQVWQCLHGCASKHTIEPLVVLCSAF